MKSCVFAIASLALFAGGAQAADKLDCNSKDLNQMQLDECAGQDFTAVDRKLNALYRTLVAKYNAADGALLKTAERAWLSYRDAECDFETNGTVGGTINPMMDTMCRTKKTNARIKELTAQFKCEEGDLSCNMPVK
jgi:uncharacterized protein YecT (DUF1311 family)